MWWWWWVGVQSFLKGRHSLIVISSDPQVNTEREKTAVHPLMMHLSFKYYFFLFKHSHVLLFF